MLFGCLLLSGSTVGSDFCACCITLFALFCSGTAGLLSAPSSLLQDNGGAFVCISAHTLHGVLCALCNVPMSRLL
jgi:hypothetical protein